MNHNPLQALLGIFPTDKKKRDATALSAIQLMRTLQPWEVLDGPTRRSLGASVDSYLRSRSSLVNLDLLLQMPRKKRAYITTSLLDALKPVILPAAEENAQVRDEFMTLMADLEKVRFDGELGMVDWNGGKA